MLTALPAEDSFWKSRSLQLQNILDFLHSHLYGNITVSKLTYLSHLMTFVSNPSTSFSQSQILFCKQVSRRAAERLQLTLIYFESYCTCQTPQVKQQQEMAEYFLKSILKYTALELL